MPGPLAKGIIITVSVLVAAGLAAYENPQIREWIDKSRHKIALALHSLGDDIQPRSRSPRQDDPSTREEMGEMAEARRRQARAEIMERGRVLEERRKKAKAKNAGTARQGSFDTLVDQDGFLRKDLETGEDATAAWATSIEPQQSSGTLTTRHHEPNAGNLHESVDSPMTFRQLGQASSPDQATPVNNDPFASQYEQEMRSAWNLPMPPHARPVESSHASESLLDLTPTSELVPDPDVSLPNSVHLQHPGTRSEYFSAAASTSSHTLSNEEPEFYYAHPENPFEPVTDRTLQPSRPEIAISVSSAPSVAGSTDHVYASDLEESDDGVLSEFGDGIRTPASAWTDVGSVVSNDD